MPPPRSGPGLLGRRRERAALDGLIAAVRAGESRALVLRGEAGVGKSALLEYVAERATGCRVVRVLAVECEMELAFGALYQLCAPLLDRLERLPAPQRDALATAFGLRAGDVPDRFLVSLAVLSLVGEAAEERPLVCLVDDAHWLDRTSAQVIGPVARRLVAESVAIVFGSRQPSDASEVKDLPELVVEGLEDDDARALLGSVVAGPLDERVRDRIIAETEGNPLALLELPRGRNPAELAGGFGLPRAGPVSARIEQSFGRRVERMPETTQRLLLRAADRMGLDVDDALAGADELITVDDRVRFRHPLVRSAVYGAASAAERRWAHAALAESLAPADDSDRRAWHRAHAAAAPDEAVAAELDAAAGRVRARGGLAAEAAFLERAAALTPDPARRAQRALRAARAAHAAGGADAASALLKAVREGPLDAREYGKRQLLEAEVEFSSGRGRGAAAMFVAAAQRLQPLDPALSRNAISKRSGRPASRCIWPARADRRTSPRPRARRPPRPARRARQT